MLARDRHSPGTSELQSAERRVTEMDYGWSLDRTDWERVERICDDISPGPWRRVPLHRNSSSGVPDAAGIYVICAKPADQFRGFFPSLYSALYVGKATLLRNRFKTHCRQPKDLLVRAKRCFNFQLDFYFRTTRESEISALEGALIECLRPSVNERRGYITAEIGPAIALSRRP